MSLSLLSTKRYIPPPRVDGVSRPHLIEKLLSGIDHPGCFTLVSGPAGFGKTTLLSEFASRFKGSTAWVSLDEVDNDPIPEMASNRIPFKVFTLKDFIIPMFHTDKPSNYAIYGLVDGFANKIINCGRTIICMEKSCPNGYEISVIGA